MNTSDRICQPIEELSLLVLQELEKLPLSYNWLSTVALEELLIQIIKVKNKLNEFLKVMDRVPETGFSDFKSAVEKLLKIKKCCAF